MQRKKERKKKRAQKSESSQHKRKKGEFALFPAFDAQHWRPGSTGETHCTARIETRYCDISVCRSGRESEILQWLSIILQWPSISCPSPPSHGGVRENQTPIPSCCSVGGVLMVRSDCKIWEQKKVPQFSLDWHTDLWLHCGSHLIIFISNISPLQHPLFKRVP